MEQTRETVSSAGWTFGDIYAGAGLVFLAVLIVLGLVALAQAIL